MTDDIVNDLALLDDWLAGKGYGEEAGLCMRAMDLIRKQADEIEKLLEERQELKNELAKWVHYWRDKDNKALSAENEKLRAALKPFADMLDSEDGAFTEALDSDWTRCAITIGDLRAAKAAFEGSDAPISAPDRS